MVSIASPEPRKHGEHTLMIADASGLSSVSWKIISIASPEPKKHLKHTLMIVNGNLKTGTSLSLVSTATRSKGHPPGESGQWKFSVSVP